MPVETSVITAERYQLGQTYANFVESASVNKDKFATNYETAPLAEEDIAFFRRAAAAPGGVGKIVAIAEAWCGDVCRELPTIARIADAAGIGLRVFLRDENPDVMDEFPSNEGRSRAIPVFIFYTEDMGYIAHFTERSASAHAELAEIASEVKAKLNLPQSATFATLPDAERQSFLRELIGKIEPRSERWRKDAIKEIRQLLATALHVE